MKLKKLICLFAAVAMLTGSVASCTTLPSEGENGETTKADVTTNATTDAATEEATEGATETVTEALTETEKVTEPETEPVTEAETEAKTEAETEAETKPSTKPIQKPQSEAPVTDGLPQDLNYNGVEITIMSTAEESWTRGEIAVDQKNGNVINDAVFERNRKVENRLGVTIVNIYSANSSELINKVTTSIHGGLHLADIVTASADITYTHSIDGHFNDLNNMEFVDLTRIYWNQSYNQATSYKGMQFTATGSMLLSPYRAASVTVFNKNLFAQANQAYLYDYVENGQWTLELQASLLPMFYEDNSCYGFAANDTTDIDAYWSALKLDAVGKDEDGALQSRLDTERIYEATDKILALYRNSTAPAYIFQDANEDPSQTTVEQIFATGRAAMATLALLSLESDTMQHMPDQYGIVPMPKLNVDQDGYGTHLNSQYLTAVAIPVTLNFDRLEEVGAVLEAMSSAGHNTVRPAYTKEILQVNSLQTQNMARMITDNIRVDAGLLNSEIGYGTVNTYGALSGMVQAGQNTTASRFKTVSKSFQKQIKKVIKKLDQIYENLYM